VKSSDGKGVVRVNCAFDEAAVFHKLAALDDDELDRFLMLCSFAHYGANQYGNSRADQKLVVKLSQERRVNLGLIDAQVRAQMSPKKYQAVHNAYLEMVKNGKVVKRPVVYENEQPAALAAKAKDIDKKEVDEIHSPQDG
jgi:hypothetical protein